MSTSTTRACRRRPPSLRCLAERVCESLTINKSRRQVGALGCRVVVAVSFFFFFCSHDAPCREGIAHVGQSQRYATQWLSALIAAADDDEPATASRTLKAGTAVDVSARFNDAADALPEAGNMLGVEVCYAANAVGALLTALARVKIRWARQSSCASFAVAAEPSPTPPADSTLLKQSFELSG